MLSPIKDKVDLRLTAKCQLFNRSSSLQNILTSDSAMKYMSH